MLTPALDLVVSAVLAIAILAGLFYLDWAVSVFAAVLFGVIYLLVNQMSRVPLLRNSRLASRNRSELTQAVQEGLGGIRDVLLDGSQPMHEERFRRLDGSLRRAVAQNILWGQVPRYIIEALGVGVIASLAVVASRRSGGLKDALPILGVLALGAQRLLPLFQRVYAGWNSIVSNQGALEDVAVLADAPVGVEMRLPADLLSLPFSKAISLQNLGFRYRDESPWVFRGVDLQIGRGERVGFVGETGCGKSTLLDVIMGLLSPSEGMIRIDDISLSAANLRHWQARVAHVPQSIFFADTSIAANIAFGESQELVDWPRVELAARRARIHDFIMTLDEGYRTAVGERGVRLSGGQRQRVGIARALYRNADVLILDEATSALDGATEASVMEGIVELGEEVTVLIVAHRLSTLDGCHLVVRMEKGKPVHIRRTSRASAGPEKS